MSVSHLWLGLLSSVVVFLACLSGSIYAFRQQITDLVNYEGVYAREAAGPAVSPDSLLSDFEKRFGAATTITLFPGENRSVIISSSSRNNPGVTAYYNPYTGELLKVQNEACTAFFAFILDFHRFLLAGDTGKFINGAAILIFVFMLFSGFVLWIPKKLAQLKKSLMIRWDARFYRLNYDLHNVLGFYSLLLLLLMAVTGLFVSFHWVKNLMIVSLGGNSIVISEENLALKKDLSDSYQEMLNSLSADKETVPEAPLSLSGIMQKSGEEFPYPAVLHIILPGGEIKNTRISKMNGENAFGFYVPDVAEFNPQGQIRVKKTFSGLALHEKFKAIAKPLHTGEIWGLPGIILYFTVSLIGCSLPVTGFIIWWKKLN